MVKAVLQAEVAAYVEAFVDEVNCLPKSAQPGAKAALAEIWNAPTTNQPSDQEKVSKSHDTPIHKT